MQQVFPDVLKRAIIPGVELSKNVSETFISIYLKTRINISVGVYPYTRKRMGAWDKMFDIAIIGMIGQG